MKLLLTVLLFCSYTCRADKVYHLECLLDKYKVSLLLYDDSSFELAGIDCIGDQCEVLMIACGRYKSIDGSIELNDKLWHNRIQLKCIWDHLMVTSGNGWLVNKVFFWKYDLVSKLPDSNSFKSWTKAMVRRQKIARDSVLDSYPIATHCFEQGEYLFGHYSIQLSRRRHYSFNLGKQVISTGKMVRNGNYLVLRDDVSHTRFMLRIIEHNTLEVVYLPLMAEGGQFLLSAIDN